MKIIYSFLIMLLVSSCSLEYRVDDVSAFKQITDSTQLLLSRLTKDGKICDVLIHDSISEISTKKANLNNIYLRRDTVLHKRIREDAFVLEDVDSITGISKADLSKLREKLQLLAVKYNINFVEASLSAEDSIYSNSIYFHLNTMGEYYDQRYLSFISEDVKRTHWFEFFEIVWEKDGLALIKHRHF